MGDDDTDPTASKATDEIPTDAVMHFYRGEMDRVTAWRQRLDRTTNWVVILLAAILTWSFSSQDNPHYVLLIAAAIAVVFLVIEAQRYQKYDVWRDRLREVERSYLAPQFDGGSPVTDDWRDELGRDFRNQTFDLSLTGALAHRLRNVYLPLITLLVVAWVIRITVFAGEESLGKSASIGAVPGTVVVATVGLLYLAAALLTLRGEQVTRREFDE